MSRIKVVGFDPSTSNWGICKATVDLDTLEFTIDDLILIETSSEKKLGVRKDSDDLRRAGELRGAMMLACNGASIAISEIPYFNPRAYPAANFNAGLVTGVLATCPLKLIQVFPREVKEAAVGAKNAAKEEIMEWAFERFPDAPWKSYKRNGAVIKSANNEHLADAVASINAGLLDTQFAQAVSMYKALAA